MRVLLVICLGRVLFALCFSAELATTLLEKYEVSHGRLWIRLKHGSHKPLQESAGTCQLRKYNVHQPCVRKNEMTYKHMSDNHNLIIKKVFYTCSIIRLLVCRHILLGVVLHT